MAGGNVIVQVKLRLRKRVHQKFVAAAKQNNQSVNKELVARLEKSLIDQAMVALVQNTVREVLKQQSEE